MRRERARFLVSGRRRTKKDERGVALITTLMLLMLLTGLTLAMAWSSSSDMLINGFYRNFRGSFYAADSGLNIMRQEMVSQVMGQVKANWSASNPPLALKGVDTIVRAYITGKYGAYNNITGSGNGMAASSWPAQFRIQPNDLQFVFAGCTVTNGSPCGAPTGTVTSYIYRFNYQMTAVGRSKGTESATITDNGTLTITATLTATPSTMPFAAWGMFIDNYNICDGSTLVPGTITGPVFTNGSWNFGTSGQYIFTDPVGSAGGQAGYQFNGNNCDQVAGPSDTQGKTTIAPTFKAGLNLGQNKIALPQNSFNQERAVLDGKGTGSTQPTSSDLHSTLKNAGGTPYPQGGASSGVYVPYATTDASGKPIPPAFTGGGIYVEGDATVTLTTVGATGQQYTIVNGGVTTTILIDPASNKTIMTTGNGPSTTIDGVPQQYDPATNADMGYATMLYVNGNITQLQGAGQGVPAVQDGTALTITAASNVTITGDILYKTQPVTHTSSGNTPIDSLIPGGDTKQALGIFTASGDIQMKNSQSNNNLEIDASLATISQGGSGGLTNIGNQIDTLTIVGGRIQNNIKNIGTTTRNVLFDRRYANGTFAPPWFPSTPINAGNIAPGTVKPTIFRKEWANTTLYNQ